MLTILTTHRGKTGGQMKKLFPTVLSYWWSIYRKLQKTVYTCWAVFPKQKNRILEKYTVHTSHTVAFAKQKTIIILEKGPHDFSVCHNVSAFTSSVISWHWISSMWFDACCSALIVRRASVSDMLSALSRVKRLSLVSDPADGPQITEWGRLAL